MRRREFISLLSGAAAWPLAVRAQQTSVPVVGFLSAVSFESYADRIAAIRRGLQATGFIEGQNLAVEYRSVEGRYQQLPKEAAELVRKRVAVIVAIGTAAPGLAAKAATSEIPIVFALGTDPVAAGLVRSMNRPEANVTGVSQNNNALGPKRLELIHELLPHVKSVAFLVNPNNPRSKVDAAQLAEAAAKIGCALTVVSAGTEQQIDVALAGLAARSVGALVVHNDAYLNSRGEQIVTLAARSALPTIYAAREDADRGGLMSYAPNFKEMFYQAGVYVGRILKGEKPADLPVQQPTKYELVINIRTAKALGVSVPLTLQYAADEVIE
jgi:putative tryptophan/tyrosine transport system substrate-binding protein